MIKSQIQCEKDFWETGRIPEVRSNNPYCLEIRDIIKEKSNPKRILEFGCGKGRNLRLWPNIYAFGIELTEQGIKVCEEERFNAVRGDEKTLKNIPTDSFDVAFTFSVLNHIPYGIAGILKDLKRIARDVYLYERVRENNLKHSWSHDYQRHGFKILKNYENGYVLLYRFHKE